MDSTGERESIFSHWFVVAIDTTTIYWDKTDKVREWIRKRKEKWKKKYWLINNNKIHNYNNYYVVLIFRPKFVRLNQVLNLFLALLLSNFGSSSLSAPTADQDTNKIAEAFNRIGRFINWIKRSIANALKSVKNKLTNQISDQPPGERINHNSWNWNEGFYPLCFC